MKWSLAKMSDTCMTASWPGFVQNIWFKIQGQINDFKHDKGQNPREKQILFVHTHWKILKYSFIADISCS